MKFDIYAEITDKIIAELESGLIPWEKPWAGINTGAISHATGRPYSLINQFLLRQPGEYITFNQCKQEGGNVKKGAKAKMVVFWKVIPKEKTDADGNAVKDSDGNAVVEGLPVLRYFNVFHISDCDGIAPKFPTPEAVQTATANERAEAVFADYIAREHVRFSSRKQDEAYYSPVSDTIVLPLREQFQRTAEYYSTMFHEATHSTGHPTRLNRLDLHGGAENHFGGEEYSKEELVAEIGAATILHEIGIDTAGSFRNSAAYIQSWLRALKNDKRLIVSAAARAEKAARLILNQPKENA